MRRSHMGRSSVARSLYMDSVCTPTGDACIAAHFGNSFTLTSLLGGGGLDLRDFPMPSVVVTRVDCGDCGCNRGNSSRGGGHGGGGYSTGDDHGGGDSRGAGHGGGDSTGNGHGGGDSRGAGNGNSVSRNDLVNRSDPSSGCTPLQHAVLGGHSQCVRVLLSQPRIDVNARKNAPDLPLSFYSAASSTPLHLAVFSLQQEHSLDIVKMLLDGGADVSLVCQSHTPFSKACMSCSVEMVQLLFDERKDSLLCGSAWRTIDGHSPHYFAVAGRNGPVLQLLLSIDDLYDLKLPDGGEQYTIVKTALDLDSSDVFKLLLTPYVPQLCDVEKPYGIDLIAHAVSKLPFLELLLEHGCRPYRCDARTKQLQHLVFDSEYLGHRTRQLAFDAEYLWTGGPRAVTFGDEALRLIVLRVPPEIAHQYSAHFLAVHGPAAHAQQYIEQRDHPLERVLTRTHYRQTAFAFDRVLLLLKAGFDPRLFSVHMSLLNDYYRLIARAFVHVYRRHSVDLGIVAWALIPVDDAAQLRTLVGDLINCGASVNAPAALDGNHSAASASSSAASVNVSAASNNEISPLALVIMKSFGAEYTPLCVDLINAGADLNHRMASSPFKCADVLINAALLGNAAVLLRAADSMVIDVDLLLTDLLLFAGRRNRDYPALRWQIYAAVGRSLRQVLPCAIKRSDRRSTCAQIRDKLTTEPSTAAAAEAADTVWQGVFDSFNDPVDSLQQLCRLVIRHRLAMSDANLESLREKVETMQIPSFTKRYLTFDDQVSE